MKYSHPMVSLEVWFQDPCRKQNLRMRKSFTYYKTGWYLHDLHLHVGYSSACLHRTSFLWIQRTAQHMANPNFAFWNFWGFLFSNIFDPWLAESADAEPIAMEG